MAEPISDAMASINDVKSALQRVSKLDELMKTWEHLNTLVKTPENDTELQEILQMIADLDVIVGNNEEHPMIFLLDYLGMLADNYSGGMDCIFIQGGDTWQ